MKKRYLALLTSFLLVFLVGCETTGPVLKTKTIEGKEVTYQVKFDKIGPFKALGPSNKEIMNNIAVLNEKIVPELTLIVVELQKARMDYVDLYEMYTLNSTEFNPDVELGLIQEIDKQLLAANVMINDLELDIDYINSLPELYIDYYGSCPEVITEFQDSINTISGSINDKKVILEDNYKLLLAAKDTDERQAIVEKVVQSLTQE